MAKKIITLTLAAVMLLSLASCKQKDNGTANDEEAQSIANELLESANAEIESILGEALLPVETTAEGETLAEGEEATTTSKLNIDFENFDELFNNAESAREEAGEGIAGSDFEKNSDLLRAYRENAVECAKVYAKAFGELHKNATIKKLGCIIQLIPSAQTGEYNEYFLFAISYSEGGEDKNVYSTARYSDVSIYDGMIANPDMFFAAEPLNDSTNALENGNITIDLEELEEAPAAETTAAETTAAE